MIDDNKPQNFTAFLTILNLEAKNGYNNKAVIGGLDKFLIRWLDENLQSTIPSHIRYLITESPYAKKTVAERELWSKQLLKLLNEETGRSSVSVEPVVEAGDSSIDRVDDSKKEPIRKSIDSPVQTLKGVGESTAKKISRLGINTIRDLIYYFPRRFMDFSRLSNVASLEAGIEQTVFVTVWEARTVLLGKMKSTEAILGDDTGNIRAVWFNQPWIAQQLKTNMRIALSGRVGEFRNAKVFENPEWEIIQEKELVHTGRMVPVYQLTRGLFPRQLRSLIKNALDTYVDDISDFLPETVRRACGLMCLSNALHQAHYPDDTSQHNRARQRLAFDELFMLQLGVLVKKHEWQNEQPGHKFDINRASLERFICSLPFELTGSQRKVIDEICSDLNRPVPMSRLLQGDVGSGKTVVATMALLIAVNNKYQGVLMAPTEILAEQHFMTLYKLLSAVSISCQRRGNVCSFKFNNGLVPDLEIALLTGSLSGMEKSETQRRIKAGSIDITVGTHALIQKQVNFKNLGLVVIDEQHRFGVLQRQSLRQKGYNPHLLVMTATPIPRTLALTLYGDLDISTINELPPGRQRIKTRWLKSTDRDIAYNFIRRQINQGSQAFIICPLIEESENLEVRAATDEYERLSREVFPELKLGLLHGKMKGTEKESVMHAFKEGKLDILISTAVVEVGVDVPNATVMLVEGADRFGLSQLHQFRGRVGRGEKQSYCLLLAENPTAYGQERLKAIEEIDNGFLLAEKDLQLRGPGEFFGTRQSGMPDLKMARLTDTILLEKARREAIKLFQYDPDLSLPEHKFLAMEFKRVWRKNIENN
jgi:ATP-dependent DNA helicase RecG